MVRCCVAKCPQKYKKANNVIFHSVPKDDEMMIVWMNKLERSTKFKKNERVCSMHFSKDDYYKMKFSVCNGKNYLHSIF